MNENLEKTPGLNNPESFVLTHNRFNTYMVLIFSDLKKAQIYKMPKRVSPHREIEIVMNFDYINVFKPNEDTEYYHIRQPNDENFLFEIGDKKYVHVGEKIITFETSNKIMKYYSKYGYNDIKYPYVYGKKTFTLCVIKNIFLFKNIKVQQKRMSINICIKKKEELKGENILDKNGGIVEYGFDFKNCKIIHDRN